MAENGGRLGKRLGRILLLLPYAIQHPGVSVGELARKFGVDKKQLVSDLNLVFLCGLPGYGPGDLIDVDLQEDRVYVRMADYFSAPLRLTPTEALALYAGAAALAPSVNEGGALERALAKLGLALGLERADAAPGLAVAHERGSETHLAAVKDALDTGERIEIEYFSASRTEVRRRRVDPWGLIAARGHWYLVGGDQPSGEERMFRLDRFKSIRRTGEAATIPEGFDPTAYKGAFRADPDEATVSLEISPSVAGWFGDYYPVRSSIDVGDGWRRVEIATGSPRWAALLILQLGGDARRVAPQSILDEIKALGEALVNQHS